MKNIIILILNIWLGILNASVNTVPLNGWNYPVHPTKKFILLQNLSDTAILKSSFPSLQILNINVDDANNVVKSKTGSFNSNLVSSYAIVNTTASLASIKSLSQVTYAVPYFYIDSGVELGYTHYFYVRLKRSCDTQYMTMRAAQLNFAVEAKYLFDSDWLICRATKNSAGDALDLVDILNNEGRVEIAEPDIMNKYQTACVSDTGFARQWHLRNTNQHGTGFALDINACQAWDTTRGDTNIIIAIFDGGISKNHPDLNPLHSFSYNCLTGLPTPPNSLGFPFSYDSTSSHGTNVAGIIGARHNNRGYAGVAPNCRLMDIAYNFSAPGMLIDLRIANGFDTAWRRGAAVINCSWVENSGITNGVPSTLIEGAMRRALNNGRGLKGSIIIFAAGNFGYVGFEDIVKYPARAMPEILAVGGLDIDGQIANNSFGLTSHYGKDLDIVVHGTEIPILDYNPRTNTNNYSISLGTSLSAPMVAGVAALILSKNPTLTRKQVCDIIESTATKLPAYTSDYATVSGRTNGTWYQKSGYGLLNAHSSIISTPPPVPTTCVSINVDNQTLNNNTTICNIINSKNTTVNSGTNVFDHVESTNINEGFVIKEGATFQIKTH